MNQLRGTEQFYWLGISPASLAGVEYLLEERGVSARNIHMLADIGLALSAPALMLKSHGVDLRLRFPVTGFDLEEGEEITVTAIHYAGRHGVDRFLQLHEGDLCFLTCGDRKRFAELWKRLSAKCPLLGLRPTQAVPKNSANFAAIPPEDPDAKAAARLAVSALLKPQKQV